MVSNVVYKAGMKMLDYPNSGKMEENKDKYV